MKKGLALLLVAAMLCGVTACTPSDTTDAATPSTTATTTTTQSREPSGGNSQYDLNMLTGEYTMAKGTGNARPVAIMVPNDSKVIGYQMGIDQADFYMECETEGSIPRLMTVFASAERIPATYGPIRSARSPFVDTAKQLGVVYTFSGATTHVLNRLDGLDVLNAGKIGNAAFWRDEYLTQNVTNYHNLVTSGEKIAAVIEKQGYSTTATKALPFTFGEKSGDITANKVQLNTTPSHKATFIYDAETGLYSKNIGTIGSCKPHKTLEGNQIQVSNVLVLHAEKFVENKDSKYTWYNFNMGSGTGYLISGGTARTITFTRTADSLVIKETDGSVAKFATGKIYMVLADKELADNTIFE